MKLKNLGVICDFGLARVLSTSNTVNNQTIHNKIGLSPRYAAPEMFSKARIGINSSSPVRFLFHFSHFSS